MREPRLGQLRVDEPETRRLRRALAGRKAVKITIKVDAPIPHALKELSRTTGVPYQTLLSQVFKGAAHGRSTTESRLDRLEREIKKMKRMLVA